MKYILYLLSFTILFSVGIGNLSAQEPQDSTHKTEQVSPHHSDGQTHSTDDGHGEHDDEHDEEGEHHSSLPPIWLVIPFVVLLSLIASGPIFFEHFWHHNYKWIAPALGLVVLLYYLFVLHDTHQPMHAAAEYFSFIALLGPLYVASGGILIQIDREGKPWVNIVLLLFGALISNIIGTTGASMLLIRPFIRLNRDRLKPYHIVFFIFMVSNIGGALTPIGDPPLFLGFLKGVPFGWTMSHVVLEWIFALTLLAGVFYVFDIRNKSDLDQSETVYSNKIVFLGRRNFIWLAVIVGAVFIDPNVFDWVPALEVHGTKYSFLREIIQLSAGAASYFLADKTALRNNEFTFAPINEVVFLFLGIFFAMMPALQLIGNLAKTNPDVFSMDLTYWATGILSGFLDNAPTYVNFLAAACGKFGLDVNSIADVRAFVDGSVNAETPAYLRGISVAAVFFGAMTYIGNGPNFMVKAIAEENGVEMPSFFGYIIRYSIVYLLPILFLVWLIFL